MTRRSPKQRGFTLVELMISLVMGLIIALAAVGLARSATTTFYEQARVSGVEANVRAASERFRSDLSRIAYMSTPNIHFDPKLAKIPGAVGVPYRVAVLQDLQGLRITPAAATGVNSVRNNITPHDVFIAGNLTSDDVYRGQFMATGVGCGGASGAEIRLSGRADAAVRRLFNGETTASRIREMTQLVFMPGERMNPPQAGFEYVVQVMDMRGCFNYMTICSVEESAQLDSVLLRLKGDGARGILTPEDTAGDVCGARVMEEVAIAPVQRVRWYLDADTDTRRIDPATEGPTAQNEKKKINLHRQLLDADGVRPIGPPEIVAEYAVDLKLGLLIDSSTTPTTPSTTNIDFEAPQATFDPWVQRATLTIPNIGPQRIRSVRYRLAFRTPLADRRTDLPMPGGPPYISRYCVGPDPCTEWARVRTIISEVALLNQAKATY